MFLENYRFEKEDYFISTDKNLLDFEVIHGYLKRSYWSENIPLEIVKNAAKHSVAFGIYTPQNTQVGYCRVVTDQSHLPIWPMFLCWKNTADWVYRSF
jgi:hypothetical protein